MASRPSLPTERFVLSHFLTVLRGTPSESAMRSRPQPAAAIPVAAERIPLLRFVNLDTPFLRLLFSQSKDRCAVQFGTCRNFCQMYQMYLSLLDQKGAEPN